MNSAPADQIAKAPLLPPPPAPRDPATNAVPTARHHADPPAAVQTPLDSNTSESPTYLHTQPPSSTMQQKSQITSKETKLDHWNTTNASDPSQFGLHPHQPTSPSEHPYSNYSDHVSLLPQQRQYTQQSYETRSHEADLDAHDMVLLGSSSHSPSYADLFFDLLFAACLNTYSNAVSLEKLANVAAFLGYFGALWWAWWSQAYFDVRYRRPSRQQPFLFKSSQRIIRAAVLGLWVAFSTTPSEFSRGSFTNFTLIYGCSRMALALDHAVVLFFDVVRQHKNASPVHKHKFGANASHATQPSELSSQRASDRKQANILMRTHILAIAACIASGLLWILSRLVPHNGVTAPLLVMWIIGVAIEAAVQIINELSCVLSPLGHSVLPERLVLFGLIILGEGFTGIAETLNKISPGAKVQREALGDAYIESGGWGGDSILQAISCGLIVVLQFGGYFHRATNQIDMPSVLIVLWAYIHVILHMASALLVIGLKKILSFQNTLNAMERFFSDPSTYLPNTPEWQAVTPDQADAPYNAGNGTSPLTTNGTLAGVSAIISVIQSNDGANIPTLSQAQRMVASVVGLLGDSNQTAEDFANQVSESGSDNALSSQFSPSLVLPFKSYFEFADNVVNPDSVSAYVLKSLFQFKYIYVASAVYLVVDIVIKTMQSSRDRKLKSFRWAMAVRFLFALVLVSLQVVFSVYEGVPSDAALDGALAICAGVLFAELVSQQAIDGLRMRLDRDRAPKESSSHLPWSRKTTQAHAASLNKNDGDTIEMETHHRLPDEQNHPSS